MRRPRPAWSNSLFEDDAEFGLGFRLAIDAQIATADRWASAERQVGDDLVARCSTPISAGEAGISDQRERVVTLRTKLQPSEPTERAGLLPPITWCEERVVVGGDGWAFDIGYGGLDHVLVHAARHQHLVLDTEVYSNTGGQASKATPIGAAAKFAPPARPSTRRISASWP